MALDTEAIERSLGRIEPLVALVGCGHEDLGREILLLQLALWASPAGRRVPA